MVKPEGSGSIFLGAGFSGGVIFGILLRFGFTTGTGRITEIGAAGGNGAGGTGGGGGTGTGGGNGAGGEIIVNRDPLGSVLSLILTPTAPAASNPLNAIPKFTISKSFLLKNTLWDVNIKNATTPTNHNDRAGSYVTPSGPVNQSLIIVFPSSNIKFPLFMGPDIQS